MRRYVVTMASHAHHLHEGDHLTDAARERLRAGGEQWTGLREAVFTTLAGFDRPASAYDIAEALSRSQARRVAANTVYRILDLFVASNLANKIESANAYVANPHPGCVHDCIFLVCDGCGQMTHVDADEVTGGVRAAATGAGFTTTRPIVEVRGRCAACQQADASVSV